MKTLELKIDDFQTPYEVSGFLHESNIQEGDTIKVITAEEKKHITVAILIVIVIALLLLFRKKRQDDGEKILNDLFEKKSIGEIEKQIEDEYGIKVEIGHKEDEETQWRNLASGNILKGYGRNEPEYFDANIKEPNPEYKRTWKEK